MKLPASIPSPGESVWYLGPLPLRAYALCIIVGIVVAVWWTAKRYARAGGDGELVFDAAVWLVPAGIIGGRLYHVVSSPDRYFGADGDLSRIPQIWTGGLGIWGAITLGALVAWWYLRRRNVAFAPFADALAPAVIVAQAIGRLGNWFNQELFGAPTTLPWGLQIDNAHLPAGYAPGTLFHPTFLYELLWNLAVAAFLVFIERRRRLAPGQLFALYVFGYTLGRVWIEMLRIDDAELIFGVRLNVWVALLVGIGALVAYWWLGRHPRRGLPPVAAGAAAEEEAAENETPALSAEAEAAADAAAEVDEPAASATAVADDEAAAPAGKDAALAREPETEEPQAEPPVPGGRAADQPAD
ncbi:prolipoprotein diacylglyceryl transferase [Buchananella hordeovulneris]|uniref:prolipoprotein diacylglyceryl transferase n=1 Tax=Buchananella hordeovulneris TaxID=52770 RepID=UPI000F5E704A|nr:prolipoprotein diacylglyceryl transferase [Buchananella hordeovulneris]RRD50254.1 prolipoprotein diacylglyceryl transferase [Buchananella hordeovulneris]